MGWSGHAGGSDTAAQQLLARARAGDQAAAQQLAAAAGAANVPGMQPWAPNHRNAAIEAYNELTPGTQGDLNPIKNPHHGFLGALGSVLKVAAPIAGMAIPGLGPLAGAAIAAGGSAAGGLLHGDKFDLGKTLLAGGAGAAGQAFNLSKLAGIGGPNIPAAPVEQMAGVGAPAATSGGGSVLSKLGGLFKDPNGAVDPMKVLGVGAAGMGFIDARKQAAQNSKFMNARLQQLQGQERMAEQDYADRAPIRQGAYAKLAQLAQGPVGSSIYGRAA